MEKRFLSPHNLLTFTEFIALKNKSKQMQNLKPIELPNNLQSGLYESLIETKQAKSDLINSEIQNQKQSKLVNDLKSTHSLIESKLSQELKASQLANEEKTKEINALVKVLKEEIEVKDKLQMNCSKYQQLNEKLKEMNTVLKSNANSPELNKLIEENNQLKQTVALKENVIEEISKELKQKKKIFNDIANMKELVDKYSVQMNDVYKEIELRDNIIEQLKLSLEGKETLSNANANSNESKSQKDNKDISQNDYKKKYEDEAQLNLKMKKSLEEISALVKSLIETKEKDKVAYAQKLNESLIKENDELKKLNDMYKSKYDIIPQLEKRFEELFHENNLLKDQNKLLQINQSQEQKQVPEFDTDNKTKKEDIQSSDILNNQIEQSIGDTFALYSIYQSSLLAFSLTRKEYTRVVPKNENDFKTHYQPRGSITYNTFEGLFIITGTEFNKLYYYSQKQNTITSIISFKENHQYGTLFLDDVSKNLILLSGTSSNLVECLSFEQTELFFLPSLIQRRAKSSCCFINSILYVFFGFNEQLKEPMTTIEYLDMKVLAETSKWEMMNLKSNNDDNVSYAFVGHSALNFNDKQVLILGGMNIQNKPNETIFYIDLSQKVIGELNHQLGKEFEKGDCLFSSHSMFRVFLKEDNACFVNIDDNHNVHILDANLKYDLIRFSDYEK